jgi:hypothetical protein
MNPNVSLIKLDDVKDSKGQTFHIGELPEIEDTQNYDLNNPKEVTRFIKDVKSEVRTSFEYRELIRYLKEYGGFDRSGISENISNSDGSKVKIEVHHTPLTIEDIVKIIYEKRRFYHEDLSLESVAKEVMECHYKGIVGLYPLTATEHELVHNGYLFIPPKDVFGRYDLFVSTYSQFMEPEDKETLEEIEEYGKNFDTTEQNKILAQSNIYIDPAGAYELPRLNIIKDAFVNRIETIKNNMYSLPILDEQVQEKEPEMKEVIFFVDNDGNRIDEPKS